MCTDPRVPDPRDALGEAEAALLAVRILLCQQPRNESVEAHDMAALIGLIHDRMRPAVQAIENFVPRDWTPPAP